jgi:hypothetical protein
MRIWEARRNPEVNTANRRRNILEQISPFFYNDDAYLTMTRVPKIGINPQSEHATPLGIYAYPLSEPDIIDTITAQPETTDGEERIGILNNLPYLGYQRWANIIIAHVEPRRTLSEYTTEEGARELVRLVMLTNGYPTKEYDMFEVNAVKDAAGRDCDCSGSRMYHLTQACAYFLALKRKHPINIALRTIENANGCCNRQHFHEIGGPAIWNGLLRKMGYDAVRDHGSGFIALNEPFQVCFLSTQSIKAVFRFQNHSNVYLPNKQVASMKQFRKLLANGKMSTETALFCLEHMFDGDRGISFA